MSKFRNGAMVGGKPAAITRTPAPEPVRLWGEAFNLAKANTRKPWARRWLREHHCFEAIKESKP